MSKLHTENPAHRHPPQVELDWHQDCLSLTVILASAFDAKAMKKLLAQAGYDQAEGNARSEELLETLHAACHGDTRLVESVTKSLNRKYRSSLSKAKGMSPEQINSQARELAWPLPLLWASFQHDAPGLKSQGRRLAHLVLWNAVSRLRKQPRLAEQRKRMDKLAQENQELRGQIGSLRKALAISVSPKAEARPAPATQTAQSPAPDRRQLELAALKKTIKTQRRQLQAETRQKELLQKELAVWRALALTHRQDGDAAPCPGPAPLQTVIPAASADMNSCAACDVSDCSQCPLQGVRVAVIGGLKRMEPNYCQVVGKLGGHCLCHTGAVASGCRRLRQVVRKADLVIFITTVNSHTAINAVKEECKKHGKPFYALGRTGAGSLEKALLGMAA